MKNILLVLFILGAIGYLLKTQHWEQSGAQATGPDITNPVYAVVRFRADIHDRSFQAVALAKTADAADCKHGTDELVARMQGDQQAQRKIFWTLQSSECTKDLDSRNLRLFDNKPTFVNYVSAARGVPSEREMRFIIWGVTLDESDQICEEVPTVQKNWRGAVTCIRAIRSQ